MNFNFFYILLCNTYVVMINKFEVSVIKNKQIFDQYLQRNKKKNVELEWKIFVSMEKQEKKRIKEKILNEKESGIK